MIEIPSPLHPFLFFGCWNTRGPARNAVADAIYDNEADVKILILGGDNVYPLQGDKTKAHRKDVFEEGMQLYARFEHKDGHYLIPSLGNHNVKKDIYSTEMERFHRFMPDLSIAYYSLRFSDGFRMIVLDTNIVDSTHEDKYNAMCAWLHRAVHDARIAGESYYIVQHEPMISLRNKKRRDVASALLRHDTLMDILNQYPPIAILCADTHNYQYGDLQFGGEGAPIIPQYVVGTGGADLDNLPMRLPPFGITEGSLRYVYRGGMKAYGYLRVDSPRKIQFKKVRDAPSIRRLLRTTGRRRSRSAKRSVTQKRRIVSL
jgi:hypothetical protein